MSVSPPVKSNSGKLPKKAPFVNRVIPFGRMIRKGDFSEINAPMILLHVMLRNLSPQPIRKYLQFCPTRIHIYYFHNIGLGSNYTH